MQSVNEEDYNEDYNEDDEEDDENSPIAFDNDRLLRQEERRNRVCCFIILDILFFKCFSITGTMTLVRNVETFYKAIYVFVLLSVHL